VVYQTAEATQHEWNAVEHNMATMTPSDDTDHSDTTHTSIEIDRNVWRQVRSDAVADGKNVSTKLEEVLEDYYDLE